MPEIISLYTWLQSRFQMFMDFWNEEGCQTDISDFKEKLLFLLKLAPFYFFSLDITHLKMIFFFIQRRSLLLSQMFVDNFLRIFLVFVPNRSEDPSELVYLWKTNCFLVESYSYFVARLKLPPSHPLTQSYCIKYL